VPIYTYEILNDDGSVAGTFEALQRMSDPPLECHPDTGRPVRRVFTTPNIGGEWSASASKERLSDDNLARHGFTKYQRSGKGQFERTVGSKGPGQIDVRN